jgi:hypothetical protein
MPPSISTDLSSFLTTVWENRDAILGDDIATWPATCVEDRVYELYSPTGSNQFQEYRDTYAQQLKTFNPPAGKVSWTKEVQEDFVRYQATGLASSHADYRVYLNVHPQHAIKAFRKVLELASVDPANRPARPKMATKLPTLFPQASPPPQAAQAPPPANPSGRPKLAGVLPHSSPPGAPSQAPPPANPSGRPKLAGVLPLSQQASPPPQAPPPAPTAPPLPPPGSRPQTSEAQDAQSSFCGQVAMAKIGDENGMFSRRPDKIVVYTAVSDDERGLAVALAKRLAQEGRQWYLPDVPPMTEFVAFGVSVGPEPTVKQHTIGNSFGQLRCNLIADALLECCTGCTKDNLAGRSDWEKHLRWTNRGYQDPRFFKIKVPVNKLALRFPLTTGDGSNRNPRDAVRLKSLNPNRLDFIKMVVDRFKQYQVQY